MQTIIIDGLTITENENDPMGKTYIKIHENIENFVLKNILVIKNQEKDNGTFLDFAEMGHVDNLITDSVYMKGVEMLCSDYSRIKNQIFPKEGL